MKREAVLICLLISFNLSPDTGIHNYIVNSKEYREELNKQEILKLQLESKKKEIIPDNLTISGNINSPTDFSAQAYTLTGGLTYIVPTSHKTELERITIKIDDSNNILNSIYNSLGFALEKDLIELEKLEELKELYIKSIENEKLNSINLTKIFELGELTRSDLNRSQLALNKKQLNIELLELRVNKIRQYLESTTEEDIGSLSYQSNRSANILIKKYDGFNFTLISQENSKRLQDLKNRESKNKLIPDVTIKTGISYDFTDLLVISLGGSIALPVRVYSKNYITKRIYDLEVSNLDSSISKERKKYKVDIEETEANISRYNTRISFLEKDLEILESSLADMTLESSLGAKTILQKISLEDDLFHYKELEIEFRYGLLLEILKLNYLKGGLKYE